MQTTMMVQAVKQRDQAGQDNPAEVGQAECVAQRDHAHSLVSCLVLSGPLQDQP